ncbi:MAG: STAS domain-containing protein [Planctomycetota bacterium]|jgi:anti-sigma B factor antagonist
MQADLTIRVAREPKGLTFVHLAGVIDAHTLDAFEGALRDAIGNGAETIVLDCEDIRYVNSAGFGELIRYHDLMRDDGGRLIVARVPPKVGVILEMLGLKSLIPIASGLEEARVLAATPIDAKPASAPAQAQSNRVATDSGSQSTQPTLPTADGGRFAASAPLSSRPTSVTASIPPEDARTVVCAVCDARLRIMGEGEWACAACGAPFTVTKEGGIAFDWSRAEADAMHLTFEVTPRSLAAFAGLIEGILVERRVPHARMRRFAREAAHVCHLLAENACEDSTASGPVHALLLAGPQRLHVRLVDHGESLADRVDRVFSTQKRLFLDFRYGSTGGGINVTEFAFAYAGSGVFVA